MTREEEIKYVGVYLDSDKDLKTGEVALPNGGSVRFDEESYTFFIKVTPSSEEHPVVFERWVEPEGNIIPELIRFMSSYAKNLKRLDGELKAGVKFSYDSNTEVFTLDQTQIKIDINS